MYTELTKASKDAAIGGGTSSTSTCSDGFLLPPTKVQASFTSFFETWIRAPSLLAQDSYQPEK
jgi:hypothetical protein